MKASAMEVNLLTDRNDNVKMAVNINMPILLSTRGGQRKAELGKLILDGIYRKTIDR